MAVEPNSNELYITRIYNSKIERVWDAWVDPEQVAEWWGPRGFTISTSRTIVTKGGEWIYTMHGPNAVDYPNYIKFLDVDRYQLLVYDHGEFENKPPMFRVQVSFTDLADKTQMEMRMTFPSATAAGEARSFIRQSGGESTWDRLAEFLEKQRSGKELFVINRSFETDIKTMYEVWTHPIHIMKWTPPTGFSGKYLSEDIRAGGQSFYEMTGNGITMYGKANYLEMLSPTRLVYTQAFADKDGKVSRHPMAPTWPEEMKTTVIFSEEGTQQTRVALEWEVFGRATPEEHNTFKNAKIGMMKGWTGSFDQLEEYIKNGFRRTP